jgi:3D (Asp-Asp-Asp) domain-containing protein
MWVVAIVLWGMLLVLVAWCLTLPPVQEDVVQSPPTREVVEPEAENVLVCDITGYCACCTPYADINRNEAGQVLTASGRWVNIGEAVAVDPDIIPLGSTVTIGGKTYIAADTGVYGYTVDVLMTHEEAHRVGVRRELVRWE